MNAHSSFELSADDLAHVQRSLRLKVGAEVEVFDGRGQAGRARLAKVERRQVLVELCEVLPRRARPGFLTAAVAIPKGKRAPLLIEKLTELGVDRIVPLVCERSQDSVAELSRELDSWLRRAVEACKQCHRDDLPGFEAPTRLEDFSGDGFSIFGEPRAALPIWSVLASRVSSADPRVSFVVGPEGGFSDRERDELEQRGMTGLRLGETVLRIETAAVALASILRARLDLPAEGAPTSSAAISNG